MTFETRRGVLRTLVSGASVAFVGCTRGAAPTGHATEPGHDAGHEAAEVTPGEDLMQEHGVLARILLIYDEAAARIERGVTLDVGVIGSASKIVRAFVEDYHEKLEEQFVFPRLEAARRESELVAVLRRQHDRGRELTDQITRMSSGGTADTGLVAALRSFVRMYRPHAAREDTVLFPAFRAVVGGAAYRELGEQFEAQEHARFGEQGFATTVADVARLEDALGIGDLASFTPA